MKDALDMRSVAIAHAKKEGMTDLVEVYYGELGYLCQGLATAEAIVRDLAKQDCEGPISFRYGEVDDTGCIFCKVADHWEETDPDGSGYYAITHAADCPWQRAQAYVDGRAAQ